MSTTMPNPQTITRKWYVIDAANKPLGRTAAKAADLLRSKNKPIFAPHVDCGDHVIIINAEKAVLTGKKLVQQVHYHHSGWVGGMKAIRYDKLMQENPEKAMMTAVKGMLPHNTLGRNSLKKLRVYAGENHDHEAQKPENWNF